jgi:transposase
MRGQKDLKSKLFYTLSIEKLVPQNHLLRQLNNILDLRFVGVMTRNLYGYNGNKSVDPVVIIKMLLLGYLYNIHSVRELMRQIADRMSFRWFIGYDIDESIPDHSVISKNLKRFGAELFRELFDRTVQQCIHSHLVGGKLLHVDSTKVKADASENSVKPIYPPEIFVPDLAPQEYWRRLAAEMKEEHPNVNDRLASTTDPEAAIISRDGKGRMLAYKDHRVVDDQHGVILATRSTSAAATDEGQLMPLVQDVVFQQGILPEAIAADTIYSTADNYRELTRMGITAHVPRRGPAHQPGQFDKRHFAYLPEADCYRCPTGALLKPQSERRTRWRLFRASAPVCEACSLRRQCTKGKGPRTIRRHVDECYVDQVLAERDEASYQFARKRRMTVVEGSFSEAKLRCAHTRARWRGLLKMQIQCYMVAAVQNLKKLLTYGWKRASSCAGIARNLSARHFACSFYVGKRHASIYQKFLFN